MRKIRFRVDFTTFQTLVFLLACLSVFLIPLAVLMMIDHLEATVETANDEATSGKW